MIDPWNPTLTEIRDWAFDSDADVPMTDFDLALSWAQHERVYLDLASNDACPKRRFFLSLLYFMVGSALRTDFRDLPRPIIDGFIETGNDFQQTERTEMSISLNLVDDFDRAAKFVLEKNRELYRRLSYCVNSRWPKIGHAAYGTLKTTVVGSLGCCSQHWG